MRRAKRIPVLVSDDEHWAILRGAQLAAEDASTAARHALAARLEDGLREWGRYLSAEDRARMLGAIKSLRGP